MFIIQMILNEVVQRTFFFARVEIQQLITISGLLKYIIKLFDAMQVLKAIQIVKCKTQFIIVKPCQFFAYRFVRTVWIRFYTIRPVSACFLFFRRTKNRFAQRGQEFAHTNGVNAEQIDALGGEKRIQMCIKAQEEISQSLKRKQIQLFFLRPIYRDAVLLQVKSDFLSVSVI